MKIIIRIYIVLTTILLTGCELFDDRYTIHGKIESAITGVGVEGAEIVIFVEEYHGSGLFAYSNELDKVIVQTDHLGNFIADVDYNTNRNGVSFYVSISHSEEDVCTDILDLKNSFYVSELKDLGEVVFQVRKFEDLQIIVKSTSPFDENDKIAISIQEFNTNASGGVVYEIINFEDANEPGEFDGGQGLGQLFWISNNVDAEVYGHLKEGSSYRVSWTTTKNGVIEHFQSEIMPVVSGELNTFDINY